jgi:16S rRNA (uracil1498-N3)-methyltransferase
LIRLAVAPPLAAGRLAVRDADHHYLFRVRRLTVGDRLVAFDGAGAEADAVVVAIDAAVGWLELAAPRPLAASAAPALHALLPLIKGERMDVAIEKLVELGARRIVPFAAARSVVRLEGARAAERHRRYQAIARAASAQCRAAIACEVRPIGDLAEALRAAPEADLRLHFSEAAGARPLAAALADVRPAAIAFLTGPEGGLADDEIAAAADAGFVGVSLGPRILRAETAAIAAAAALGFALGDLGHDRIEV